MKKIVNVNIGGVPFTLDDDAYEMLSQYLDTIRDVYHTDDDDLMADIESRMAELLLQDVAEGRIVTLPDVEREIRVMGDPHDFEPGENVTEARGEATADAEPVEAAAPADGAQESEVPPVYPPQYDGPKVIHKLYRDGRNKMIAGVCSGIAAYSHISVSLVRILAVIIFFLSLSNAYSPWIVPFVYVAFWIALPEARTPLEYMQLYGEQPSVTNIGRAVSGFGAQNAGVRRDPGNDRIWDSIWNVCKAILMAVLALLVFVVGVPLLIALIVVLIAGIMMLFGLGVGSTAMLAAIPFSPEFSEAFFSAGPWAYVLGIVAILSMIGVVLIPLIFIIRAIFKLDARHEMTPKSRIGWLIVWIACIVMAGASVAGMALI